MEGDPARNGYGCPCRSGSRIAVSGAGRVEFFGRRASRPAPVAGFFHAFDRSQAVYKVFHQLDRPAAALIDEQVPVLPHPPAPQEGHLPLGAGTHGKGQ